MDEPAGGRAMERGGAAGDLVRALDFLHGFARRRAPREVPVPGGFAVLDDRFPGSYDDNKLIVATAPDVAPATAPDMAPDMAPDVAPDVAPDGDPGRAAGLVIAAAEEVMAGHGHRMVCVDDDRLGTAWAPAFAAAGYEHETNLVMAFRGAIPAGPPPAERLGLEEMVRVLRRDWRRTLPQAPEETIDGLALRVGARLRGAATVGFRGVRAPDGEVAARADVYVHGGAAQIESVFTGEPFRGKGYARALMTALLAEAAQAELIFLLADAGDWPRHFYARLGFTTIGHTHAFLRT